jgi:hypothetical protein
MICGSLFLPQSTSYKTSESFPKMLNGWNRQGGGCWRH